MSPGSRLAVVCLGGVGIGVVLALGALAWRAAPGKLFGQPVAERAAQRNLPHSADPIWATLESTRITEDKGRGTFAASFPQAVSGLAGRTLSISGFMLPLESRTQTEHFLLTRNTPVCFFCPPGQPNEVIEVRSSAPVYPDTGQVTVTGRFGLQHDGAAGLFFSLDQAEVSG